MDLSTSYLGFALPHPFLAGAGPFADDLDTVRRLEDATVPLVILRSLFEEQINHEQAAIHRALEEPAHAFAEALTYLPNPETLTLGPEEYLEQIQRIKAVVDLPVVASLNGTTPGGWLEFARLIHQAGADALELNLYRLATDPAISGEEIEREALEMVRAVREAIPIPIAVKLSPFYSSLVHFAQRLVEAGADGLVIFNRFYQPDIDIEELRVERVLRLSDPSELLLRLRWLALLHGQVNASLAVTGGVHRPVDAIKAVMCGAHAVQLVSSLLRHGPEHVMTLRRGVSAWMEEKGYQSLSEMRGSMSLAHCPDPHAYERANYIQILQTWMGSY